MIEERPAAGTLGFRFTHAFFRQTLYDDLFASRRRFSSPFPTTIEVVRLLGFIRITTNPAAFPNPLRVDDALTRVEAWLAQPTEAQGTAARVGGEKNCGYA